jgi:integration host factor subunit beta
MTRAGLVAKLSKLYPYMSIRNIDKVISIVLNRIIEALMNGSRVELRGFGTFTVKDRKESVKRNPRTGEKIISRAHRIPCFRSGKQIKDLINGRNNDELAH